MTDTELQEMPLFPLPDTLLFPSQVMPLHIFEPRYRLMTRDLLDGSGEMAIGTVLGEDQKQLAGQAPVQKVVGIGRLEKYEKLEDGRYLIVLLGVARGEIEAITDGRAYPTARIHRRVDEEPAESAGLQMRLRHTLLESGKIEELPPIAPTAVLADLLASFLKLKAEQRYNLFSIPDVSERANRILAEAAEAGLWTDPGSPPPGTSLA